LEVITFLSTRVLYEFILSKMAMALHLLKIDKSEIRCDGNLWSRQVIEK
jgi:hypothetical protein